MTDQGRRRPSRRAAAGRFSANPAASHYVGYVEDDETPESITRKFEELERIRARGNDSPASATNIDQKPGNVAPPSPSQAVQMELTEEQLIEVFKQTSSFTVPFAARDQQQCTTSDCEGLAAEFAFDTDEGSQDPGETDFWSGYDSDGHSAGRTRKREASGQLKARDRGISMSADKPVHEEVVRFNPATHSFVRRRVRVIDPAAIERIQVPSPPLPFSWGRTVRTWQPHSTCDQPSVYDAMLHASPAHSAVEQRGDESEALLPQPEPDTPAHKAFSRKYQAVLVNPGWAAAAPVGSILGMSQKESCAGVQQSIATFASLPIRRLCPSGFVCVWVEKHYLHGIMKQMHKWGYTYVENLTWVQVKPNNETVQAPSSFLPRSHLTLLMFRREGCGKDIELRHQRRPDVFIDCIRTRPEGGWHVPEEAYLTLETLLPTGLGQFLEIWAGQGACRAGWTSVSDPNVDAT